MLFLAVVCIFMNSPHGYWLVDYGTQIKTSFKIWNKWEVNPRKIQAYLFSFLISTAIAFLVLLGYHKAAFAGCVLETFYNCLYVHCSFEENFRNYTIRGSVNRKRFVAYVLAVSLPLLIFVFTWLYMDALK